MKRSRRNNKSIKNTTKQTNVPRGRGRSQTQLKDANSRTLKGILKTLSVEEINRILPLKLNESGLEPEVIDPNSDNLSGVNNLVFNSLRYDPATIRVVFRQLPVDLLLKRMIEHAIDLNPSYQRSADIWDRKAKSRLIESLLIRIPLPVFYIDSSNEDRWAVIDGSQRLSTFKAFAVDKTLKLTSLEFLPELEGHGYDELPRSLQRRFLESYISLYLIEKGTPREVKLSIYERINTGGTTLSPQEIRHAIFEGPATKLLEELVDYPSFKQATNNGVSSLRMADRECALRFLAFYLTKYQDYNSRDMEKFLNQTMDRLSNLNPEQFPKLKEDFDRAMKYAFRIFGKDAFRKPVERAQVNKALFETWSYFLAKAPSNTLESLTKNKSKIITKLKEVMSDDDFVLSISSATVVSGIFCPRSVSLKLAG